MIETSIQLLVWACLLGGSLFAVIGGLGILRLPDVYTRMHGAGITDTLGAGLILVGLMIHSLLDLGQILLAVKLLAILFFLLVTSPTSTHALAASALAHGVQPALDDAREDP